jgi:signal peptidase
MVKKEKKPESRVMKAVRYSKNAIFAVLLVVLVGILIVTMLARVSGKSPSLLGFAVYRVSSGSMEPTLKVGDVILSQKCNPEDLAEGDIVSYEGSVGEFKDKIVTHRVQTAPYKENGEYYLVTKGDNNPAEDSPILFKQVCGKMIQKLDFLAMIYDFFITPWGLISIILLIILAFFNEIIIFVSALLGIEPKDNNNSVENIIEKYRNENITKALDNIEIDELIEQSGISNEEPDSVSEESDEFDNKTKSE